MEFVLIHGRAHKMASINKFIGIGNLTKDPVTRYSQSGDAITNITIACNETWKDKDGSKQGKVEYINVTFYRKLAEIAGEYLKKCRSVYIEGRLETRKWTDKNGVDRYTTDIIATDMKMLGNRSGSGSESAPEHEDDNPAPSRTSSAKSTGSGFDDMEDDIPF